LDERGRKRPDQRLPLANNANADDGERRFHRRPYGFGLPERQARKAFACRIRLTMGAYVPAHSNRLFWRLS
jgi:hypothetical protein